MIFLVPLNRISLHLWIKENITFTKPNIDSKSSDVLIIWSFFTICSHITLASHLSHVEYLTCLIIRLMVTSILFLVTSLVPHTCSAYYCNNTTSHHWGCMNLSFSYKWAWAFFFIYSNPSNILKILINIIRWSYVDNQGNIWDNNFRS